jgi:hypothetical protein
MQLQLMARWHLLASRTHKLTISYVGIHLLSVAVYFNISNIINLPLTMLNTPAALFVMALDEADEVTLKPTVYERSTCAGRVIRVVALVDRVLQDSNVPAVLELRGGTLVLEKLLQERQRSLRLRAKSIQ